MVTLVKEVVNLEDEAESILASVRAETKQLEKACEEEIAAYHKKMTEEMIGKIAEFQKKTEETHRAALSEAERELKESLDALNCISDDVLVSQVERIVSGLTKL
jgi:F0F1-type ATP synthase membrane subunit b/b'